VLGPHAAKLVASSEDLPDRVCGGILVNELLDALPTHVVEMTAHGVREVFVARRGEEFIEVLDSPSSSRIPEFLGGKPAMRPGWRAEVNLAALDWIGAAARSLDRGFLIVIDYGHDDAELYSSSHSAGTLSTFHRHTTETPSAPGSSGVAGCLADPGDCDMTAHVDLTAVTKAAEEEGLTTLGRLDQTYFLLGLGLGQLLEASAGPAAADVQRRLALKTLMLPGGLGSTHKVLLFGKGVGTPSLLGCSYRVRLT
jgi:SAM-dependent MidA family methyltransferase